MIESKFGKLKTHVFSSLYMSILGIDIRGMLDNIIFIHLNCILKVFKWNI